jgi:hypothetical protein
MKKQFFSGKLYLQSIKKVRTLGIAVLIAVVLLNMFMPIMGIIKSVQMDRRHEQDIIYYEEHKAEWGYGANPDYYEPQVSEIDDFEFAPFFRRNKPSGTPDGAIFRKEDTLFFTAAFTADHLPRRLSLPEAAPTVVSRA